MSMHVNWPGPQQLRLDLRLTHDWNRDDERWAEVGLLPEWQQDRSWRNRLVNAFWLVFG